MLEVGKPNEEEETESHRWKRERERVDFEKFILSGLVYYTIVSGISKIILQNTFGFRPKDFLLIKYESTD